MTGTISFRAAAIAATVMLAAAANARADAQSADGALTPFPYCQVVDRFPDPLALFELGYIPSNRVDGGGRFSLFEARAASELGFFRTGRGDLAFALGARTWFPAGGGALDLPDALGHLALRVQWDIRGYNAFTLRLDAEPGFYADLSASFSDGFAVPFGVTAIQSFTDRFSGFAGLRIRPEDRRVVDPTIGLRLSPVDPLIIDIGYPVTRVLWQATPHASFEIGAELDRRHEFALEADDLRDRLRLRESRFYGGFGLALTDFWRLQVRSGVVAGREIGFRRGEAQGNRDVEGGFFLTIGIGGVL